MSADPFDDIPDAFNDIPDAEPAPATDYIPSEVEAPPESRYYPSEVEAPPGTADVAPPPFKPEPMSKTGIAYRGAKNGFSAGLANRVANRVMGFVPEDDTGIPRHYNAGSREADNLRTLAAEDQEAAKADPWLYYGSNVAASLPAAIASGGSSLPGVAGRAALLSGTQAFGDDTNPDEVQALKDAAPAAAAGALTAGVLKAGGGRIVNKARTAGPWLRRQADRLLARQGGATKGDLLDMEEMGGVSAHMDTARRLGIGGPLKKPDAWMDEAAEKVTDLEGVRAGLEDQVKDAPVSSAELARRVLKLRESRALPELRRAVSKTARDIGETGTLTKDPAELAAWKEARVRVRELERKAEDLALRAGRESPEAMQAAAEAEAARQAAAQAAVSTPAAQAEVGASRAAAEAAEATKALKAPATEARRAAAEAGKDTPEAIMQRERARQANIKERELFDPEGSEDLASVLQAKAAKRAASAKAAGAAQSTPEAEAAKAAQAALLAGKGRADELKRAAVLARQAAARTAKGTTEARRADVLERRASRVAKEAAEESPEVLAAREAASNARGNLTPAPRYQTWEDLDILRRDWGNKAKFPPGSPQQQISADVHGAVADQMENVMGRRLGAESAGKWRQAGRDERVAIALREIAKKRELGDAANRLISPSDYAAMGLGLGAGMYNPSLGIGTAAAGLLLNRTIRGREHGLASIAARKAATAAGIIGNKKLGAAGNVALKAGAQHLGPRTAAAVDPRSKDTDFTPAGANGGWEKPATPEEEAAEAERIRRYFDEE